MTDTDDVRNMERSIATAETEGGYATNYIELRSSIALDAPRRLQTLANATLSFLARSSHQTTVGSPHTLLVRDPVLRECTRTALVLSSS